MVFSRRRLLNELYPCCAASHGHGREPAATAQQPDPGRRHAGSFGAVLRPDGRPDPRGLQHRQQRNRGVLPQPRRRAVLPAPGADSRHRPAAHPPPAIAPAAHHLRPGRHVLLLLRPRPPAADRRHAVQLCRAGVHAADRTPVDQGAADPPHDGRHPGRLPRRAAGGQAQRRGSGADRPGRHRLQPDGCLRLRLDPRNERQRASLSHRVLLRPVRHPVLRRAAGLGLAAAERPGTAPAARRRTVRQPRPTDHVAGLCPGLPGSDRTDRLHGHRFRRGDRLAALGRTAQPHVAARRRPDLRRQPDPPAGQPPRRKAR